MVKVYKPQSAYSQQTDTGLSKTALLTSVVLYGKRINKTEYASNPSDVVVYTVPEGKVFFLISAILTHITTLVGGSYAVYMLVGNNYDTANILINAQAGLGNGNHFEIPLVFGYPLKFNAGESFQVHQSSGATAGCITYGTIIGYEIDSSLIPNFV